MQVEFLIYKLQECAFISKDGTKIHWDETKMKSLVEGYIDYHRGQDARSAEVRGGRGADAGAVVAEETR